MIRLFFLLLISCLLPEVSSAQSKNAKSGLFYYVSDLARKDSVFIHKIWFHDSVLIQEEYVFFECGLNDSIIHEGYEPYKYTYYDLRTKKCQDYFSFSDTASVECNYIFGPEVPSNLYGGLNWEGRQRTEYVKDTLINNRAIKVIKLVEVRPGYNYRYEENYYFQKGALRSDVINLDNVIKRLFPEKRLLPEYNLIRIDNITYPEKIMMYADYYIVRDALSVEELKIFDRWKKNATETKLPVISMDEVLKMPKVPIRYKDDPICNPEKFAKEENK